jgi:NADH:ubiquinone oxidoreductase subunit C
MTSIISSAVGGQLTHVRNSTVLTVAPDKLEEACKMVVESGEYYHLSTITGVDEGQSIAVLYHFWRGKGFITVKTSVPKENPKLQSVIQVVPAAIFYEAEVADLLGVTFKGNPLGDGGLLLPPNYPASEPRPLRREADPEKIKRMMQID